MNSMRYQVGATTKNLSSYLDLLKSANTTRVILFASPVSQTADMNENDGPVVNLPLLAALAEVSIPGVSSVFVVFDGLFLTAARYPRYTEIRELLDASVESGKVFFSSSRAPFTSSLSPDVAASRLQNNGPIIPLTNESRPKFFSLLSVLKESEFK